MVISQVDTDEVVERWQFDIQCENTAKGVDEKGEKRFASATIIALFKEKSLFGQIFVIIHKKFPALMNHSDRNITLTRTPKTIVSTSAGGNCPSG